jgi:hypothetical protein
VKKIFISGLLVALFFRLASGQSFTGSNLPIVVINTDNGAEIPDEPKIPGTMKIIDRGPGERNYVSDQNNSAYLNYNGRIKIEIRGSSSQAMPKKQYGFTTMEADMITNNNVKLLGMPAENDWILNGMVFDPALIRDYLSYNLSRQIGQYASRTAYCEIVINGVYKGLYVLQEKIKADDNRVNVTKIDTWDNAPPEVTGGYITKADKTTGGDPVAWTMYSWFGSPVTYIHDMPKPENVTPEQNDYIRGQFDLLETTAYNGDISVAYGFPSVIDIPSFIDYIIINELGSNADAYTYSAYFHKDRNGKLRAGPIWDMDLTYGNDLFLWGYDRSKPDVWQFSTGDNDGSRFWKDLFTNSLFRCYLTKRWNELIMPAQPLNPITIDNFIDQTVSLTGEAVVRNYSAWDIDENYQQQIADIKSFIDTRISWMTSFLGSYSECSNIQVPQVIINKINYHPSASFEFPESEDLEFIELLNNGDQPADMTGIYFGGTGLVYQFPAGSLISSHSSVYLASNIAAFRAKYGFTPFGQFTRHLSNKSEDLILMDAFGNIIDNVTYSDTIPWPDADGNGKYLLLKDPSFNNSLAENWLATNDIIVSERIIHAEISPILYPNPVSDILNIQSSAEIRSLSLFDIYGREVLTEPVGESSFQQDMAGFPKGIYIIKIVTSEGSYTEKIIKD